jgi:hypothetical protein
MFVEVKIEHEYHIVELDQFNIPQETVEWLRVKYGPGDGTRWFYKNPKIYFADPKDHLMFLLRWG